MATNESTVMVPNTRGKQVGLSLAWVNNNEFATFAFGNVLHKRDHQAHSSHRLMGEINLMKPDFILADPAARTMLYECGHLFYTLQRRRYGLLGGQTQTIDFVDVSQQYRKSVRQTLQRMKPASEESPEDSDSIFRNMLYSIECVWHLVEILIVDSNASSGTVVTSLLQWIRYHFPGPERDATALLQDPAGDVEKRANYWPLVKALILQGHTMVARALLRVHPSSDTRSFQVAEQLLQSLPIYNVHDGLSVHKYKAHWQCWRDNVHMLIEAGNFGAEPYLEEILRLISGDRVAWRKQQRSATCWYEYLPGFLLYTDSSCRYYQLSQYANEWMMDFASAQNQTAPGLTFLDKLVLAIMDNNLPEIVVLLQQIPDNNWCAVHIVDLLYHAGLLHGSRPEDDPNGIEATTVPLPDGKLKRESLLYDFGSLLMAEGTYWQLGMGYLEFSSTEGLGAREALLARVPIRHEAQALKLIAVARKNDFPGVIMEVCKVLTKRNLAHRRYGSALDWAIRSRDSTYVRNVANIFLEHYCNHGELLCEKMIANLGQKIFISSQLVFLKKYYDFRLLYRKQEYAQAAELLISLMDSNIVPSYFWPCLMADVIPLLEFKEPIIPSAETLTVLRHLQLALVPMLEKRQQTLKRQKQQQNPKTSAKSMLSLALAVDVTASTTADDEPMEEEEEDQTTLIPKFSSNLLNNCTEDLVNLLRLACIRNLSRAYVIEHLGRD
ncbi:nuclear pore complex protein Nup75 [Anopheles ziemanni]|uniref:nuclear pore complex protein Nup75 n=1 Tax=Anopheles coustani TaxID=139045 RepID=UPI002658DEA6|nr:nuclear pore complex protein Nup75 [Anopheles coustani]XP_058170996.1 nuclear pore complex protein Nup75 [Anopheles ziemanni]